MPCEVPTLDFGDMGISGPVSKEFLQSLDKAMTDVGFFYLGGLDAYCDLDAPIETAREFFALPVDEKFSYSMGAPEASSWFRGYQAVRAYPRHLKGYAPYQPVAKKQKTAETAPLAQPACESVDLAKHVAFETYMKAPDRLDNFMEKYVYAMNPQFPDNVTTVCNKYARKIDALGARLMEVFALALGFDPVEELREHANEPWSYYRLINYKGGQKPPNPAMMPAHTDFGWLTILNQSFSELASLEMQDSETKDWRPIPAKKGTLIINIGDMMAKWTRGRYIPQVHRVIHTGANDRISVPFFFNPSIDAKVDGVCYGEHLMEKLAGYHAGYLDSPAVSSAQLAAGTADRPQSRKQSASFTITFKGVDADGRSMSPSNAVCVKSV
jgi:isopenicillin N synthase-like dioxygenase